ncbi:DUF2982 domain-containing protein [Pseudoalteromonas sp. MB47]|uniref:DUF2982 domain-containing protein n=1 Tax=Pseudoalteromonas sp. MB47 TaxID=2588452 RepID=UPI0014088165|nr:DUF2982 domain-containing protein [Pseudoalteromonas sp. MB47]NHH89866.1 hypothetical protein [Pseudoalteromonas sp. MB47]
MDKNLPALKVRAQSYRHGSEFLIVGGIGLIIIMLVNLLRPGEISIVEIFLATTCIAAIFIGFLKTQEPYFSLTFTQNLLIYHHKIGNWQLNRANFHHSGIPKVEQGLEYLELNAVGIKLNNIDEFLTQIHPRIAGRLLIEQRHLFMQVIQKYCKNGDCPSEWLIEETDYTAPSGQIYKGLIAMFANRTQHLRQLTGYDLLLPANVLDVDIWQFSADLNRWKLNPKEFLETRLQKSKL